MHCFGDSCNYFAKVVIFGNAVFGVTAKMHQNNCLFPGSGKPVFID
jgi:hypothetical protein